MPRKIQEGTVDVSMANVLTDFGIGSVSLLQMGGVPDIYLLHRGLRVIVELKEEGQDAELREQCRSRIRDNLCDLVIGLVYPSEVVTADGTLATPREVERRLRECDFVLMSFGQGAGEPREVVPGKRCHAADLPELIGALAGEAFPEKDLEEAIAKVKASVERFVGETEVLPNSKELARNIKEVLEGAE